MEDEALNVKLLGHPAHLAQPADGGACPGRLTHDLVLDGWALARADAFVLQLAGPRIDLNDFRRFLGVSR